MESKIVLLPGQEEALVNLKPGSILLGDVGSGKTFTSLAYYQKNYSDRDLYVITTAKKRDTNDWYNEAIAYGVDISRVKIDSWANIKKYVDIKEPTFFIFDEQKAIGSGAWSKAFIKIAKGTDWILATGSPGDTWMDYVPVFIANGFYKNRTEFINKHVEYDRFAKYPKIKAFHNTEELEVHRDSILVKLVVPRHTNRERIYINGEHDEVLFNQTVKERWNPYTQSPIRTAGGLTQVLRRITGTYFDRVFHARWIIKSSQRVVIFYNYNYELQNLIDICEELEKPYTQWNGHAHEEIPSYGDWAYLVQYTAGAEGWNCITTDTMLFYSPNYAYKVMEQAEGRIDRMNTPFSNLKYYYLTSSAPIDIAVLKAIKTKSKFNEAAWAGRIDPYFRKQVPNGIKGRYSTNAPRSNNSKKRSQLSTRHTRFNRSMAR